MSIRIAFNSANLVGRYSNYRFSLSEWMQQHTLAAEKTGVAEWDEICREIRACGYDAIEVWVALVERCGHDPALAESFVRVMRDHGLEPVALAGPLNDATAAICQALKIPAVAGGYFGSDKPTSARLMRQTGILYNFENHPEASVQAIREQIDFGSNGFAVALDIGWLATQHVDAPRAVRELGRLIRHVHVKDVKTPGKHDTVKLGTGCVDIPGVIAELKAIGFTGVLSWEDEPENRNPFDIAAEMRQYIHDQWFR